MCVACRDAMRLVESGFEVGLCSGAISAFGGHRQRLIWRPDAASASINILLGFIWEHAQDLVPPFRGKK